MQRSLQASSFAVVDKVGALQKENEALHTEVEQLSQELDERNAHFEHERRQLRTSISELEQQLHSMAVGYEQVEQTSENLVRENARLKVSLEAAERARVQAGGAGGAADRSLALEREAAAARQRAEELQTDRADLLELLGRIVAACPDAAKFVAPLGTTCAASAAGCHPGEATPAANAPALGVAPALAAAGMA